MKQYTKTILMDMTVVGNLYATKKVHLIAQTPNTAQHQFHIDPFIIHNQSIIQNQFTIIQNLFTTTQNPFTNQSQFTTPTSTTVLLQFNTIPLEGQFTTDQPLMIQDIWVVTEILNVL